MQTPSATSVFGFLTQVATLRTCFPFCSCPYSEKFSLECLSRCLSFYTKYVSTRCVCLHLDLILAKFSVITALYFFLYFNGKQCWDSVICLFMLYNPSILTKPRMFSAQSFQQITWPEVLSMLVHLHCIVVHSTANTEVHQGKFPHTSVTFVCPNF